MGFVNPGRDSSSYIRGKKGRTKKAIAPSSALPRKNHTNRSHSPSSRSSTRSRSSTPSISYSQTSVSSSQVTRRKRVKKPKPIDRNLTPLEALPTELLQKIFLYTLNPSLSDASLHLCRSLGARHLFFQYVRHAEETNQLSGVLKHRFFNARLLADFEMHYETRLDATGAFIPQRLCCKPWLPEQLSLFEALVERGAGLDPSEADENLDTVYEAIQEGRWDIAGLFVGVAALRPDNKCLRLVIEHCCIKEEEDEESEMENARDLCEVLIGAGADPADVGVWRAALEGRKKWVDYLLKKAVPPSEVLGALSQWN